MFSSTGGTQIDNTSAQSQTRYQLSHPSSPTKLGGNRPPEDNPLLFLISGTGSFMYAQSHRHGWTKGCNPPRSGGPFRSLPGNRILITLHNSKLHILYRNPVCDPIQASGAPHPGSAERPHGKTNKTNFWQLSDIPRMHNRF